jgi:hypothetical protein
VNFAVMIEEFKDKGESLGAFAERGNFSRQHFSTQWKKKGEWPKLPKVVEICDALNLTAEQRAPIIAHALALSVKELNSITRGAFTEITDKIVAGLEGDASLLSDGIAGYLWLVHSPDELPFSHFMRKLWQFKPENLSNQEYALSLGISKEEYISWVRSLKPKIVSDRMYELFMKLPVHVTNDPSGWKWFSTGKEEYVEANLHTGTKRKGKKVVEGGSGSVLRKGKLE